MDNRFDYAKLADKQELISQTYRLYAVLASALLFAVIARFLDSTHNEAKDKKERQKRNLQLSFLHSLTVTVWDLFE